MFPACCCDWEDDSACYKQLWSASNLEKLRATFEKRLGLSGDTLRFVQIKLAVADSVLDSVWAITSFKKREKFIIVYDERRDHDCNKTCIVVAYYSTMRLIRIKRWSLLNHRDGYQFDERYWRQEILWEKTQEILQVPEDWRLSFWPNFTWGCCMSIFNYLLCKISRSQLRWVGVKAGFYCKSSSGCCISKT